MVAKNAKAHSARDRPFVVAKTPVRTDFAEVAIYASRSSVLFMYRQPWSVSRHRGIGGPDQLHEWVVSQEASPTGRADRVHSPQTDQIGATRAELPFTSSVLRADCFPSQKENCQPSLTRDAWHQLNAGSSILFEAPLCCLSCIGGQDGWQFKLQEIKQRFKCR